MRNLTHNLAVPCVHHRICFKDKPRTEHFYALPLQTMPGSHLGLSTSRANQLQKIEIMNGGKRLRPNVASVILTAEKLSTNLN